MIKKLNLLVLMLLTISINTLYAEERIIIIGERTTNNSIICGMGACRDFLDSLNQGVDITFPSFEGGDGGGGGGGTPEDEEECKARIDSATVTSIAQCQDAVVVGGASMGGAFCLSIATITSFFATPLVGGFAGVACATAGAVGGNDAHKACRYAGNAAGDKQKEKCK